MQIVIFKMWYTKIPNVIVSIDKHILQSPSRLSQMQDKKVQTYDCLDKTLHDHKTVLGRVERDIIYAHKEHC